jgi:transcriptional regulator with XRE-family HTH domain
MRTGVTLYKSMNYNADNVIVQILANVKKLRYTKQELADYVKISRQTLDNYIAKKDLPLSTFIEICNFLKLNPSYFFENMNLTNSNVQNATGENIKQVSNVSDNEKEFLRLKIEFLERENAILRELNDQLKK